MNVKIGSIVGNWKVISERYKENNIWWNDCECICGTKRKVRNFWLNHSKTKSCGCKNTKGWIKFNGFGDLSSSYFNSFKYSRTRKNIYFSNEITIKYLWELFLKQNKKCALSGIDLILNPQWSKQNKGEVTEIIQNASLDRIDSKRGYELNNIQWVHKDVNMMKGSMNEIDFISFCKKIYENNIHKTDLNIDFNKKLKWYGK